MINLDFDPKLLFGVVPDKEQMAAIQAPMGVNVVLAGPGAGKSTVIVCRILYLAKVKKVNTRDITLLVFNRDAKESLSRRLKVACDRLNLLSPEVCTIHSKCYQIVRNNNYRQILLEEKDISWYESRLKKHFPKEDVRRGDYERIRETISKIRENNLDPVEIIDPVFGKVDRVIELLGEEKMSFEDISFKALEFLRKGDVGKVKHLLVDESQDITEMQFRIIQGLCDKDLFMVGDADQCIYGFRHASSRYIESPEAYFQNFALYHIGTNYRSTNQIVKVASEFITKRCPKTKRPFLRAKEGREGPWPVVRAVSRQVDQFRIVRDMWHQCNKDGKSLCVIYRNNSTAVALANFLVCHNISSCHLGGGNDFFETPLIKNILRKLKKYIDIKDSEPKVRPEKLIQHIAVSAKMLPEMSKEAVQERMSKTNFIHDYMLLCEIASSCQSVCELLDRVEKIREFLQNKEKSNLVLATAHSVKGLEFHTVLIVDVVQGIFPADPKRENMESEARLMYVAMTRATDRLVMLYPEIMGGRRCVKSEFLKDSQGILSKNKGGQ